MDSVEREAYDITHSVFDHLEARGIVVEDEFTAAFVRAVAHQAAELFQMARELPDEDTET